jgi:hypothetical protein
VGDVTESVCRDQRLTGMHRSTLTTQKGNAMDTNNPDTPDEDITMDMLRSLDDGSVKSLGLFFVLRRQLDNIRGLPERQDADRNVPRHSHSTG